MGGGGMNSLTLHRLFSLLISVVTIERLLLNYLLLINVFLGVWKKLRDSKYTRF